jgi:hypothetical protein
MIAHPPPSDISHPTGLEGGATNVVTFDVFTIPHIALGYIAASAGIPLAGAIWGALALEAAEIGLSHAWPELMKNATRESRANQLGDLAGFLGGYKLGER